jgi:hypothetical protein
MPACGPTPIEPAPTAAVPGTPDGIENASDRPCTWTATSNTVTVTYAGVSGAVTFTMQYSFPSPDVLRLDADEFGRVS